MYKKSHKNKIILSVIILMGFILSIICINFNVNFSDIFFKDGFLFIDNILTKPFRCDDTSSLELEEMNFYKEENAYLKDEIKKLKESFNLNSLLSDSMSVNATVINRNFDGWNDKLLIDKGFNQDISNNMAVISSGSLIGITNMVSLDNSSVLLLTNPKFPNVSVKVLVGDNAYYGILNNYDSSTSSFEVMGVVENVDIPSGSRVVTTGLGNIFPSGLLVGYVSLVTTDNFDLSKIVMVKSDINFDDIEYVTVVGRDIK